MVRIGKQQANQVPQERWPQRFSMATRGNPQKFAKKSKKNMNPLVNKHRP
jgi:hypothetical protein